MTLADVNAACDLIDEQIATLRAEKAKLAAERAALVADEELNAKLDRMTPDERQRLVLKPVGG